MGENERFRWAAAQGCGGCCNGGAATAWVRTSCRAIETAINARELYNHGILIGGRAGGYLAGGQYLELPGESHNNLYVELINAMLPAGSPEVTTFGNPALCTGGIPELRA